MTCVVTIVGARPQFIKAAAVSRHLRKAAREILVHTGQHYDEKMSGIFFRELEIPAPDINLGVGSGHHGAQTGAMLAGIEALLIEQKPDVVLVYGDTNSTLAGALAACKLGIPVAHVEAGLRSFNRSMPEEHNRVLTDHCSDLLLCPTDTAVANLAAESVTRGVYNVGDTMLDMVRMFSGKADRVSGILERLGLEPGAFLLATLHRPYTVDRLEILGPILQAFMDLDETVVFPVHPRTRGNLEAGAPDLVRQLNDSRVRLVDPVGYLDMLRLEKSARVILTDSGGVQKEAFFLAVPCVTLRPETEWVETVSAGWNRVIGSDPERIASAVGAEDWPGGEPPPVFGDGKAGLRIVELIMNGMSSR